MLRDEIFRRDETTAGPSREGPPARAGRARGVIRRFGLWGLVLCAVSLGACTEEAPLAPDMPMRMRPDGGGIDGAWVTEDAPPSLLTRCGEMMPASDFAGPYCPGRDEDGDGFGACDCCDSTDEGCTEPARVNPGAIEVAGNGLDDDCDGTVDNAEMAPCDADLRSASADPFEYARAMDLCRRADAASGRWGVIEARFALAGGCGDPASAQRSIRTVFGATPLQRGASMVVLSSGSAAAPGQTDPGFTPFHSGLEIGSLSRFPEDWLTANGGALPAAPGCPATDATGFAHDSVMLELRIRAPRNAASFTFSVNFMSAEYPSYVCTAFNDFFVVLLDSAWGGSPANPGDKNLAFHTGTGGDRYPIGVNLACGATGLFRQCAPADTFCGATTTCSSSEELFGTGMDFGTGPDSGGGGTGWLTARGNVVGGEIFTLRIALWDTGDHQLDSLALLDNFQWSLSPSEPGTVICLEPGAPCFTSADCCRGECRAPPGAGDLAPQLCIDMPECREEGQSCGRGSDCCRGDIALDCLEGVCAQRLD